MSICLFDIIVSTFFRIMHIQKRYRDEHFLKKTNWLNCHHKLREGEMEALGKGVHLFPNFIIRDKLCVYSVFTLFPSSH